MQPSRRIDHDRIVTHSSGIIDRLLCRFCGRLRTLFKYLGIRFSADDFQLLDCRGTINIARNEQRFFPLLFQLDRKFAAHRGFPRALQTAHHDHRGRFGRNVQLRIARTHQRDQFLVYDFDDLLRRIERLQHLLPDRFFGYFGNKLFCYFDVDVRL